MAKGKTMKIITLIVLILGVGIFLFLLSSAVRAEEGVIEYNPWLGRTESSRDGFTASDSYIRPDPWVNNGYDSKVYEIRDSVTHEYKGKIEYNPWLERYESSSEPRIWP
jgi:hypothetical protein